MERTLPVASLLSLTIAALLSGCGGSGGNDTVIDTPATKALDVRAVDGYLKGAVVWLDTNADYALSAGEPQAVTDGSGKATLDVTKIDNPGQYRVLVKAIVGQTSDVGDGTATPKPVTKAFTMSAPAGVSTITPLTTLVEQKMTAAGLNQEQAAQEVATQLGLGTEKAAELLKDFIAEKNNTGLVYALNIVAALPESLDDDKREALLTQGGEIGKALEQYLAQNPLGDDNKPEDIKVVIGDDGKVDDVIKDSDGDGQDDDDVPPVLPDSLSSVLLNANDLYMVGDGDEGTLWTDHWQTKGDGLFGWIESNVLLNQSQYIVDPSTDDLSYRLADNGWTATTDYEDIKMVANSDGSLTLSDVTHAGTLSGGCKSVAGETLASVVGKVTDNAQIVAASATFSSGAQACLASYHPASEQGALRIQTWGEYENAVYVAGNKALTLNDLFSSSAPVASGPDAVATVFEKPIAEHSERFGDVRLVLVRSSADATSGVAQLWQYNANLQGYQLLSNVTPADHQGWGLKTVNGVPMLSLSNEIRAYLGDRFGYSEFQGRVQVVEQDNNSDDTVLFLNQVGYGDLMKGRTLQQGGVDTPTFDSTYASLYLRGTFNNWDKTTPMTLVADHLWSATVTLSGSDKFKFDVSGDWATNFGDNELDGVADANGKDITTSLTGSYVVTFNDETRHYQLQAVDKGDSEAAAAFADLVTSKATIYSVYSEDGKLGITKVTNASEFAPYVFDYSSNQLLVDQAHLGTGKLVVNDDDSVALLVANEQGVLEQDGVIRCTEVQDLNATLIKTLLAKVTDPAQLAVMEAKFAGATFSTGAKAYINTHSYADSNADVEVVLNEIAYQDLLKVIGSKA